MDAPILGHGPDLCVALPLLVRDSLGTIGQMPNGTGKPRWGLVSTVRCALLNLPAGSALAIVPNVCVIALRSLPTIASPRVRSGPRPAKSDRLADPPIGVAGPQIQVLAGACGC